MKNFLRKSSFASVLLSAFLLGSCQQHPSSVASLQSEESSIGEVSSASNPSISSNPSGVSVSFSPEPHVRERDNGVIVIMQLDEWLSLNELTFRVDSLNEEFTLKLSRLSAKGADRTLLWDVRSLYLADVNKDGYDDFIYTTDDERSRESMGWWVGIYDYHNGTELYRLDEELVYNYQVYFENHQLVIDQSSTDYYNSGNYWPSDKVGKGVLDYSGSTITTRWENFLNIDSFNISVTTPDSSRTPITLTPGEEENTYIIEHASLTGAYCITTNIVRNSGKYDDLVSNELPVGFRFEGIDRIFQAASSNTQDNLIVTPDAYSLYRKGLTSATLDGCVSGHFFKIILEFDWVTDASDVTYLKDALGWDFSKENLTAYIREYIPGNETEETYPFMYMAVASSGEATKQSYNLLEGRVSEIDPALVRLDYSYMRYKFTANNQVYKYDAYGPFITTGGAYYAHIQSISLSYANGSNTGYLHFRDGRTEVEAVPAPNTVGLEPKVLQKANTIIFTQREMSASEKTYLPKNAKYVITIAGNDFSIVDAKTMIQGLTKFTVTSNNDFSPLFAK